MKPAVIIDVTVLDFSFVTYDSTLSNSGIPDQYIVANNRIFADISRAAYHRSFQHADTFFHDDFPVNYRQGGNISSGRYFSPYSCGVIVHGFKNMPGVFYGLPNAWINNGLKSVSIPDHFIQGFFIVVISGLSSAVQIFE